jgi:hypothetical protein
MILKTKLLKGDVSAKMPKMTSGGKLRFISINLSFPT